MRTTLFVGLLLVLFALGVVQAHRVQEEDGPVSGWMEAAESPGAASAGSAPDPVSPPARRATTPAAPPSVLAAGELSVLDADAEAPMLRYFDDAGSLHMVRGLERVPAEYRADAVEVGRGNVNVVSIPAPSAGAFRDWQPDANPNRSKVVLFSAPWCGACKRAKRHLDGQGVAYRERDIDRDASAKEELQRILGRIAIPLLDVDGRYISGFRPDVYDRALGRI